MEKYTKKIDAIRKKIENGGCYTREDFEVLKESK